MQSRQVERSNLIDQFKADASDLDVLIFSDFSYGVLQSEMVQEIISIAKNSGVLIAADSQTSSQFGDLAKFKNVDLMTPTETEARLEARDDISGLVILAEKLRKSLNPRNIILKLGPDGLLVHGTSRSGELLATDKVAALNLNPIDTSGAGDSLLVGAALSYAISQNIYASALIGSVMSGIQVSRLGNIPISINEILDKILS